MRLTKNLLKKIIKEEIEQAMGDSSASKKLSRNAIRHLENNFSVEHDPYEEGPSIGHVADEYETGTELPKDFIATEESPNKDEMDDDQRYRHAELGNYEYWVGTYKNWEAPESEKIYKKTGESLDGYFVIEHTGTGWNYIAGPFDSAEQAKSEGAKLAKDKGMITYDELAENLMESKIIRHKLLRYLAR